MMLLPYISEPATGSRMPSMSTGGAATNAVMKQMVAANRVGIISTPNQPTYRRLLVEVTQEQKFSQVEAPCWRERVEAIVLNKKVRPSGKWWSYYFFLTLRGRYERRNLYTLEVSVYGVFFTTLQNFTFPVVDLFIIRETRLPVNPLTPVQKLSRLGLSRMNGHV